MIYLYGILAPTNDAMPNSVLDGQTGVTGEVAQAKFGDLVLIHSPHDGSEILPRRRSLLAHARVLEMAMRLGTVLPMRFGMTCQNVEEFWKTAEGARAEIGAGLERVEGRAEVGVRVSVAEAAALEATVQANPTLAAERDHLARRGHDAHFAKVEFGRGLGEAVAARRKSAQKDLLERVRPLSVDHVVKAPETDFEALRAEFLIETNELPAFSEVLDRSSANLEFAGGGQTAVRIVGPGPAFHFVDLALDMAGEPEPA